MSDITREEFVTKWLEALRSGSYQQIEGRLHEEGVGYCCLGVACSIAAELGLVTAEKDPDDGQYFYNGRGDDLPKVLQELLGMDHLGELRQEFLGDLDCVQVSSESNLAEINDETTLGFKEIADIIEKAYRENGFFVKAENE